MNNIEVLAITNINTGERINVLDGIRIERDIELVYRNGNNNYNLKNAMHVIDTEIMNESVISFVSRLEDDNDYDLKRFVNRYGAVFKIEFSVNGAEYHVYCVKGDQEALLDYSPVKRYMFEMICTTRFLREYIFKSNENQTIPGKYAVGKYGEDKYMLPVDLPYVLVTYTNDDDHSAYIELSGVGTGQELEIQTGAMTNNGARHVIKFKGVVPEGIDFFYTNVPNYFDVRINNERRVDILNPAFTNFEYDIPVGSGTMYVSGLENIQLKLLKGYNII